MYKDEFSVFIPNSFLSESKDIKVRTYKVGIIGRALAVYQVKNVVIYNDNKLPENEGKEDAEFIAEVLNYMNTPQYLRKRAFPIKPELKHVGILPPLRTPHHPTDKNPKVDDFRYGFTVKRNNKGTFVDIGMDKLAFCKEQLTVNKIFSFKITKIAKKEVIVTPDEPDDIYWGYNVILSNKSLKNSLKLINPDFVVETTRLFCLVAHILLSRMMFQVLIGKVLSLIQFRIKELRLSEARKQLLLHFLCLTL